VRLRAGSRLRYELATRPTSWEVRSEPAGAVTARWDGAALELRAHEDAQIIDTEVR
jgi:hypothetical protein